MHVNFKICAVQDRAAYAMATLDLTIPTKANLDT